MELGYTWSRRRCPHTGSLLGLAQVSRMRAASPSESVPKQNDTGVTLVWLAGGLSHMDTYDLKPEAPLEYRGEFVPIRTNVPGIDVGELLPLYAKIADRGHARLNPGHWTESRLQTGLCCIDRNRSRNRAPPAVSFPSFNLNARFARGKCL